ncbi:sporulation protein [Anaerobacillus alkaliphilus]|uniref:Sporulation protein n=1 Tax=Anaerobacillus alkaliphilus TaxID=1548597 RepID=A0A4Q0VRA9_9BACI|nr:Spo0B C-terminal domain-containing protein [Anaerobacillus alkaliphilus]RXI99909.1 sporulation protein [Anaerobacillus alkaliphilus]
MKEDRNILQILRHSRHDWLNVIQLIKGNLTLKKYDRVEEIIQEIVNQTQNESKLSNLNMPKFASDLLVFNWVNKNHFQLEFEVIGDCVDLQSYDERLLQWFMEFSNHLNESCERYGENHLQLTVELMEEELPRFTFDFHGSLQEVEKINKFLGNEQNWNEQLQLVESYINKEEFYITIQLV